MCNEGLLIEVKSELGIFKLSNEVSLEQVYVDQNSMIDVVFNNSDQFSAFKSVESGVVSIIPLSLAESLDINEETVEELDICDLESLLENPNLQILEVESIELPDFFETDSSYLIFCTIEEVSDEV